MKKWSELYTAKLNMSSFNPGNPNQENCNGRQITNGGSHNGG